MRRLSPANRSRCWNRRAPAPTTPGPTPTPPQTPSWPPGAPGGSPGGRGERLGEREVLCHALNNLGTARYDLDGGPEGVRELERSLALAFELGHEVHVARAYANLSAVSVSVRRLDAAETYLRGGLAYCE